MRRGISLHGGVERGLEKSSIARVKAHGRRRPREGISRWIYSLECDRQLREKQARAAMVETRFNEHDDDDAVRSKA